MEFLPILRLIWRRRLLVAVGALAAIAAFVALGGTKPVARSSAVAWTRVSVDTPRSQLIDVAPPGADSLAWRALLITHLIATDTLTQEIAARLGVRTDQVMVADPGLATPLVPTSLAQAAATAASGTTAPYVLSAFVKDDSLPVISIETVAPDLRGAVRLAHAAVAVLQSQASPGGGFDSLIPTGPNRFRRQPFVIEQISSVRDKLLTASAHHRIKAVGVSFVIFLVWCGAVLLLPKPSRKPRPRRGALPA